MPAHPTTTKSRRRARRALVALCGALAMVSAVSPLAAARVEPRSQHAAPPRGIVQQVMPGRVLLRALDGTARWLTVPATARVTINRAAARLADVQPGFVAQVTLDGKGRVTTLLTFGAVPVTAERGTIQLVEATSILIARPDTTTVSIALDAKTAVTVRGRLASAALLQPGFTVVARRRGALPAITVAANLPPLPPGEVAVVQRGIIAQVDATTLALRGLSPDGPKLALAPTTLVFLRERATTTAVLQAGMRVEATARATGVVVAVRVLRAP
ncbi:MAG: hypothetical protein HYX33_03960 [Actinobacteria bacterium]|nr:hypothetical protein [Actinomycetota bacterium]